MAHQLERVLRAMQTEAWCCEREYLQRMVQVVVNRSIYGPDPVAAAEAREARAAVEARHEEQYQAAPPAGTTAIVPIIGPLMHRGPVYDASSGVAGLTGIRAALAEAERTADRIVLDIESPGGTVSGIMELADVIAGIQTPVVAVVNASAASAAYWLATAADEVVMTPSGLVGSVGVIAVHEDISAMLEKKGIKVTILTAGQGKGGGNPTQPLGDETKTEVLQQLEEIYGEFVSWVAERRGVSMATVKDDWQAKVYRAKRAVALGMVDRIGSLESVLREPAASDQPSPGAILAREHADSRARIRLSRTVDQQPEDQK